MWNSRLVEVSAVGRIAEEDVVVDEDMGARVLRGVDGGHVLVHHRHRPLLRCLDVIHKHLDGAACVCERREVRF